MSSRKKKSDKVVSLVERKEEKDPSGISEAIQNAAKQFINGEVASTRVIVILDEEGCDGVHIHAAGIDKWDGVAMLEMAKFAIMFNDQEAE